MAQGKTITPLRPEPEKILAKGATIFYAGSPYLSIGIHLTHAGAPMLGAKVRMNEVLLRGNGYGDYAGAYYTPFKVELGQEQVFTIETFAAAPVGGSGPPRLERVVLARYRVDRLLQWLSPRTGETIDLAAYPLGELPLRWKFVGTTTPVKGRLRVIERGGRGEIINRVVEGDECTVPIAVLRPDMDYLISIDTSPPDCGSMGVFKLGKIVAPGSEVHFEWEYGILLRTAPAK
jgi:hypothetical protein